MVGTQPGMVRVVVSEYSREDVRLLRAFRGNARRLSSRVAGAD